MHTPLPTPAPEKQFPIKILVVDDEPANLLAVEATLAELKQEQVFAQSGEEALRALLDQDFAAVLLDVHMPMLNGFETAKLIRARDRSRHTPIIFITAYDSAELPVAEAYALGAVDYLVKPLMPEVLRAKVAVFVELFRLRAAERSERRSHLTTQLACAQATAEAKSVSEAKSRILQAVCDGMNWNCGAYWAVNHAEGVLQCTEQCYVPPLSAAQGETSAPRLSYQRGKGLPGRVWADGKPVWVKDRRADRNFTWQSDDLGHSFRGAACLPVWGTGEPLGVLEFQSRGIRELDEEMLQTLGSVAIQLGQFLQRKQAEDESRQRAEQLAEAGRRKDQFLAMLAHELRNPLAPVLNGLQILRVSAANSHVSGQTRDMIERQIHQLTRLIDDLLDASRMAHGMLLVEQQMVDLAALVRTTAEDRRGVVEQTGMKLHVEVPKNPAWIVGDATRLAQIVNNLLDNAVKFRNGGDSVKVRLTVEEDRSQALIEVSDQGIGIGQELFPRLFDAFGQASQSLARQHGGLGLGLSVVKGLVELHGGEVKAASGGPGRGAVFTIRLPLKDEQKVVAESSAAPPRTPTVPLRILIIEDNRDGADSLRMLLELLGHETKVAYNGIEGVRLAKEWRPEVVLCDIGLPGLDGYGVARELRADPATRDTTLIAVTGYGQEDDRRRARQAGFDYHLTKPVNPGDLQSLLVRPA